MSTLAFLLAIACMLALWSAVAALVMLAGRNHKPETTAEPSPRRSEHRRRRRQIADAPLGLPAQSIPPPDGDSAAWFARSKT